MHKRSNLEPYSIRRLTDGAGHYFFGYYDNPAFNASDTLHLYHKAGFMNRMQEAGDTVEIGLIECATGKRSPLAETTAWNFQQGAMLQWDPNDPENQILYNDLLEGQYVGVCLNIRTGSKRYLDAPIANVDPTGRYALSINFSRMFDYRPGYGYAEIQDPWRNVNYPEDDGIYRIDLHTGRSKLILSLADIWTFIQPVYRLHEAKLTINHINFNTDGTRFVFLARCKQGDSARRVTATLTANADGSGLHALSTYEYASHYHWRDKSHLLLHSANRTGDQLYLYKDLETNQAEAVDPGYFTEDGHCSYSPDRQSILYDSYPDERDNRHLYMYHVQKREGSTLGVYYSDPRWNRVERDIRCDLHPRWNRSGTAITFDSMHEGQRHIYYMDLPR